VTNDKNIFANKGPEGDPIATPSIWWYKMPLNRK
jgi:hypothetical protein